MQHQAVSPDTTLEAAQSEELVGSMEVLVRHRPAETDGVGTEMRAKKAGNGQGASNVDAAT